ncbi:MAG: hypothetical protein IPQ01_05780 [Zoogloea sp.]|nr:hypothetical protein [Zoogloea sp.]
MIFRTGEKAARDAEFFNTLFNEDLNNRQLHPDQITRIRQLNKNNSEREAQQLAVLCYLQKCDIAGMDGRLSGDAARLYQTGAQLLVADPQWFSQLQGEILADSALLRGNNSYGYLDKSADLVGSTHYKGMGPTYQNVLVQPAKDYVSEVAESSKNTVVSSAKTVRKRLLRTFQACPDTRAPRPTRRKAC